MGQKKKKKKTDKKTKKKHSTTIRLTGFVVATRHYYQNIINTCYWRLLFKFELLFFPKNCLEQLINEFYCIK